MGGARPGAGALGAESPGADLVGFLIRRRGHKTWRAVAEHVLGQEHWARNPRGAELLASLVGSDDDHIRELVRRRVLSKAHWRGRVPRNRVCAELQASLL